ncbi:hypothetical protein L7E55_14450 [Pelotomaculum isophthalicicum JI]|uniref:Uncharacterized protein n=1 Tax=Pelotomaculum isophthalicicum JI TaxID=947010 RepID=A0A9X4H5C8_9FIRM|nr:hypothetical protein [Pelotomaculum isophthalicicum]MDF9409543.1 hypothetical protein [Pelotomaculum isophthalicicum JI]
MSIIASIILGDRILQLSDSRVMNETSLVASLTKTVLKCEPVFENDSVKKLYQLKNNLGLAWCGVQKFGSMTIENALDNFEKTANFNLPPAQLADILRDHLADYWAGSPNGTFCFHLSRYYRGFPYNLIRFNPHPPADLIPQLYAPTQPYTLRIDGASDEEIQDALKDIRAPLFERIGPVEVLGFAVDMVFRVIDNVDCCGAPVQIQIILPDRIVDFKATRNPVLQGVQ